MRCSMWLCAKLRDPGQQSQGANCRTLVNTSLHACWLHRCLMCSCTCAITLQGLRGGGLKLLLLLLLQEIADVQQRARASAGIQDQPAAITQQLPAVGMRTIFCRCWGS